MNGRSTTSDLETNEPQFVTAVPVLCHRWPLGLDAAVATRAAAIRNANKNL